MDEFNVEVVGFGNSKQNCGSGIALRFSQPLALLERGDAQRTGTYFEAVKLSERHLDERGSRSLSVLKNEGLSLQWRGLTVWSWGCDKFVSQFEH